MAYVSPATTRSMGLTKRTVDYGYGLSDIQEARENLMRQNTMGTYANRKQFTDLRRAVPGADRCSTLPERGLRSGPIPTRPTRFSQPLAAAGCTSSPDSTETAGVRGRDPVCTARFKNGPESCGLQRRRGQPRHTSPLQSGREMI